MAAVSYLIPLMQVMNGTTIQGSGLQAVVTGTNPPGNTVATVTAASAVIAATNDFTAGLAVVFAGSFGTVTGLSAGTTYYVSATGLSSSQFEVSATLGGSVITPGGSSSATPTVAALGCVEIRMDQTTTVITDAQSTTGTRALKKGEIQYLLQVLQEYLIYDTNVVQ
jgi:hypothetical protein